MTIPGTTWQLATGNSWDEAKDAATRIGAGQRWHFFIRKLANGKWGVWA